MARIGQTKPPVTSIRLDNLDQIRQICELNGLTVSEYVRGLIAANLEGMPAGTLILSGVDEGYRQGRALAARLAHAMLTEAQELLPETYEEAIVRYGSLTTAGRPRSG